MLKKLVFVTLLLMFLFLYLFRIEIIRPVVNVYLSPFDVSLGEVRGLRIGWDTIDIDRLAVYSIERQTFQYLENIVVRFSLGERRIRSVAVQRLMLSTDVLKDGNSVATQRNSDKKQQGDRQPLLIDELLLKLRYLPINSILIHECQFVPQGVSYRMLWKKETGYQRLAIS